MSLEKVPAEHAAMTLEEINQALQQILEKWQASVAGKDCPADVATQYYEEAAKLIESKRLLESLQGKATGVQSKAEAIVLAAQVAQAEQATTEAAAANGQAPKKKPKKSKPKVVLAMAPETQWAEQPPDPVAPPPAAPADPGPVLPMIPVVASYSDAQALADGTLVDVSALKVEIQGTMLTRMTAAIFARMQQAVQAVQQECLDAKAPFVPTVAWRNWIVSQIKQAVIKGDILQVPRTPTSGAIWIMENEGGGFTMLSPSDY